MCDNYLEGHGKRASIVSLRGSLMILSAVSLIAVIVLSFL